MFWKERSLLDLAVDRAIRNLKNHPVGSDEYNRTLDSIVKLHKMKTEERSSSGVSRDTLAVVGGNLLGILMIIGYERVNVVTSRAMSLLLRPR